MRIIVKPEKCFVCGENKFEFHEVLWRELILEWELNPNEVDYINKQQGFSCSSCKSNLRSMTLAKALLRANNSNLTLNKFVQLRSSKNVKVLEVNEAGNLHHTLSQFKNYVFAEYPEVDLHQLPYDDESFDLVVHSDTLEHVTDPVVAMHQILRVLRKGGKTVFTTPIIVDRTTRARSGMAKSFHGAPGIIDSGMLVTYEYGSDFWKYLAKVGFSDIRIITEMYPAGIAFVCTK